MTATDLLSECKRAGIHLEAAGDRLEGDDFPLAAGEGYVVELARPVTVAVPGVPVVPRRDLEAVIEVDAEYADASERLAQLED